MADWQTLTHEQKLKALMDTYGLTRAQAERHAAIADGQLPRDVVGLAPAEPLGGKP